MFVVDEEEEKKKKSKQREKMLDEIEKHKDSLKEIIKSYEKELEQEKKKHKKEKEKLEAKLPKLPNYPSGVVGRFLKCMTPALAIIGVGGVLWVSGEFVKWVSTLTEFTKGIHLEESIVGIIKTADFWKITGAIAIACFAVFTFWSLASAVSNKMHSSKGLHKTTKMGKGRGKNKEKNKEIDGEGFEKGSETYDDALCDEVEDCKDYKKEKEAYDNDIEDDDKIGYGDKYEQDKTKSFNDTSSVFNKKRKKFNNLGTKINKKSRNANVLKRRATNKYSAKYCKKNNQYIKPYKDEEMSRW